MTNDFVHLHVHSEYSMLDGLGRIKDLVKEANRLGQKALALTDHGVMHGAIEFFRACKGGDIKPIIGVEAYQTVWGRPMSGRDSQQDRENYHLLLIAQNMTGYRNLLKIASQAQLQGYYYKPRVDHEFLAAHAEGLICTTGCLGAEVPQLLMQGRETEAYERFGWYVDVFGKDNFYIELQEHSIPELIPVNKSLVPWADKFGIGLLATNDVHYVKEEDADPHEMLLCVQTGESIKSDKRMKLSDQSYFLKSREQMEATFRPYIDLPASAFDNSLRIAEMCDVDLEDDQYHLPDIEIPEGHTYETYLRHVTEEGLARLYGERANHPDVQERKERELRVIHQMGFDVYFLIVADLCDFARSRNIWWNVRGSGAGSLVAYCTGITGLDPLKNNLIFERFLNPARVTMPDFDLDYPDDQREEMIRYTIEKYGNDQVAQIVTFGRMKARAAIRDVGRAQEVPLHEVDRIAKLIPAIPGKPVTIKDVMTEGHEFYNPELVQLYKNEPWVTSLLDYSMKLEGVARHSGIHAAAVIVADRELTHYAPLMKPSKGSVTSTVAQFEFPILESIGLLKVDFLGLSTLSVMREAGRLIKERHGTTYTLANIPFEGSETEEAFKLLSSGEVSGVFQVESAGMRRVLTEMQPHLFEHIIATISLYRPGPIEYIPNYIRRLHGEEEVEFKHKTLEPILGETLGICVSGDALVMDARTGRRYRLDEVDQVEDFVIQGVDEEWQPALGRVTHWIDSGYKPVYRVKLRNGAHIKVTADHRLLTEDGWQPLEALTVGDYIATPFQLFGPQAESGMSMDRRRLRVLAYLIADGSLASMASVDFVSKDLDMVAEYERCLTVFDDLCPVRTQQIRDVIRVGVAKDTSLGLHYHTPTSLLMWMRKVGLKHPAGSRPGGLRSHEKFVPPFVFELGEDDLAFFLASLWDCDGYIGTQLCHYKTVSSQLAQDVQTLLLRLGIRSTIYEAAYEIGDEDETPVERSGYQVTVYDTARLSALLQPYMVTSKANVLCQGHSTTSIKRLSFIEEVDEVVGLPYRTLMREYGIDRQHFYPARRTVPRIETKVVQQLTRQVHLPATSRKLGVAWEEIVAIEAAGEEHVYDLTVAGLHSFVANNIIVHNCIYQEQIIQILTNLAGYTPGEADLVRRAISKKKASDIEKHKKIFIEGCAKNNIPKEAAAAIYGDIEFFARYGFNKCLPGDVEVLDAATGRLVKVEELFIGKVTINSTLACDTASLKLETGAVSAVMDNGVKPVYRLTTALGRTIEATANHPFYTFDGWRLLDEIEIGTQIAVPRQIPVEGKYQWPAHQVITLGHLLAEGNLCHPHSVYFYSQDAEQVDDYVQAAEKFDNTRCSIAVHKGTFSIYAKRQERTVEAGITTWAKEIGVWGKGATEKEIPATVFTLKNAQIGLLISRMWEGDGHINTTDRSLYYATSSQRMAHQLQHLMLRLGILTRLRTVEFSYKDGRIGYQLFVTGNQNIALFEKHIACHFVNAERRSKVASLVLTTLASSSTKDVIPVEIKTLVRKAKARAGVTWTQLNQDCGVAQREFYPTGASTKSGFTRETIVRLADYFADEQLRRYGESDIYWDKVTGIEYVGEKQTYDLEVPGLHNFIANDILVHNSHAADYAVITVQTAFLKAHYPVEYMAALLLIERDKTEKVVNFLNECRRMGISVLPPDVNYSRLDFEIQEIPADIEPVKGDPMINYRFPVPEGSAIRFGMAAVKMVGEGPVQMILDARDEGGPFRSLEDFADRVDLRKVGKRPLECLIKVGAFDRFGKRSQLLAVLDQMVANSASVHDARASGQLSMFDLLDGDSAAEISAIHLPGIDEVKGREKLTWEKELLGVYAASHPMQNLGIDLSKVVTCYCNELSEEHHDKNVVLAGMISDVRVINTKKGDQMAFVNLEDLQGKCEVVVFPRTYAEVKEQLVPDTVVVMKGKAQTREGQTNLLVDSIQNYVEQAKAGGEEPNPYQRSLLDSAPTINGLAITSDTGGDEDADDLMMAFQEDEVAASGEENPFANDLPSWMQDAPAPVQEAHSPSNGVAPTGAGANEVSSNGVSATTAATEPADADAQPLAQVEEAEEVAQTDHTADVTAEEQEIAAGAAPAAEQDEAAGQDERDRQDAQSANPITVSKGQRLNVNGSLAGINPAQHKADQPQQQNSHPDGHTQHRQPTSAQPDADPATGQEHGAIENGHNGNGHSGNGHSGNGHSGNGHSENEKNGSGHDSHRPPRAGHRNGQRFHAKGRHITITFRRTGDLDRDKFRLKEIFDRVRDPRGRDQFFIRVESNGQRYELAFPNDPCTINERLVNELTKHFRVDVAVEEDTA